MRWRLYLSLRCEAVRRIELSGATCCKTFEHESEMFLLFSAAAICESGEVNDVVGEDDRMNLSPPVTPWGFGLHDALGTMALEISLGMNSRVLETFSVSVHIKALARRRVVAHQRVFGTIPRGIWKISRDPNGDLE